ASRACFKQTSRGDPRNTREVATDNDVGQLVLAEQISDGVRLREPVLQQEPAAGFQIAGSRCNDELQCAQAVSTGTQRRPRLEANVPPTQVRIIVRNIRGIANDEVESQLHPRLEPLSGA